MLDTLIYPCLAAPASAVVFVVLMVSLVCETLYVAARVVDGVGIVHGGRMMAQQVTAYPGSTFALTLDLTPSLARWSLLKPSPPHPPTNQPTTPRVRCVASPTPPHYRLTTLS